MDTSRVDGVKAPQHRGTLKSNLLHLDLLFIFQSYTFLFQLHALVRDLLRP